MEWRHPDVKWTETDAQMVTFIEGSGKAVVEDGTSTVSVIVVDAIPKYI